MFLRRIVTVSYSSSTYQFLLYRDITDPINDMIARITHNHNNHNNNIHRTEMNTNTITITTTTTTTMITKRVADVRIHTQLIHPTRDILRTIVTMKMHIITITMITTVTIITIMKIIMITMITTILAQIEMNHAALKNTPQQQQ